MSQTVDLEVFYPHPPERVWQVLTDRRALAAWMMENNFAPKLGHKFQFYSQPLPGFTTTIQCEVVELEEPTRLGYTWQESSASEPSLVIWTLTPVTGGTQLRLKHYQHSYATAASSHCPGAIAQIDRAGGRIQPGFFIDSRLSALSGAERGYRPVSTTLGLATVLEFHVPFAWDYYLNQTLPNWLAQAECAEN